MAKQQLIKIDGVDVTSKRISSRIDYLYQDEIDVAVIEFRIDVNNVTTLSKFQEVTIWENFSGTLETDANRKFNGNIAKIERDVGKIKVTVFSFLWRAIQSEVNQTFDVNIDTEAGVGSEIFITLAGLAGITADSGTVVDTTPTGIILDKFVCSRAEVFERWQTLADIYAYQFFERYDTLKAHFEPLGFELNTNTIQVAGVNNNVQGYPTWKEDSTKIFNRVEVIGAFSEVRTTESFDGDASTTTFILTEEPEIVEITVDGTLQIGGVLGATSTFDYAVDKKNKQIIFQSGSVPGVGVNNIVVDYSYRAPRPVIQDNDTSISELGRIIKNRFTFNDIESVDDAERRGDNLLDIYSDEFVTTKLKMSPEIVEEYNLLVGQSIRVIDDRQGKDLVMVIKRIVSRFPESDVELELGDKEIRLASFEYDSSLRIKRLEEEQSKSGTFVVQVKKPKHTLIVDRRDLDVAEQDYDATSEVIILGVGSTEGFFDIGTGKLGSHDDAFLAEAEHTVSQGNNVYNEDFNDTDYNDSSTATWDGSGSVNFTSGQVATSLAIDSNNGAITTAKLTSTEVSGTILYELSATLLPEIAHWKMNDNAANTTMVDRTGNHDMTLQRNSSLMTATGQVNEALDFNGSSDFATLADDDDFDVTTALTIAVWIFPDFNTGRDFIIQKRDGTNFPMNYGLEINSERAEFWTHDSVNGFSGAESDSDITLSAWNHVAATYDAGTVKMYLNGSEVTWTLNGNAFLSALVPNTELLSVGASDVGSSRFDGKIDDLRFYKSVLSSANISEIYNLGNGTEERIPDWETVTSGTKHFFDSTGTDLRWRATENAASTGEISNILINEYH